MMRNGLVIYKEIGPIPKDIFCDYSLSMTDQEPASNEYPVLNQNYAQPSIDCVMSMKKCKANLTFAYIDIN